MVVDVLGVSKVTKNKPYPHKGQQQKDPYPSSHKEQSEKDEKSKINTVESWYSYGSYWLLLALKLCMAKISARAAKFNADSLRE